MRVKKRPFHFFLLAILLGIFLGYLINTYPPSFNLNLNFISMPIGIPMTLLFLGIIFSFCAYLFNSVIQGLIIAIFAGIFFLLRIVGLNNVFFLLLFFALFGTTELFFLKKK